MHACRCLELDKEMNIEMKELSTEFTSDAIIFPATDQLKPDRNWQSNSHGQRPKKLINKEKKEKVTQRGVASATVLRINIVIPYRCASTVMLCKSIIKFINNITYNSVFTVFDPSPRRSFNASFSAFKYKM